MTTSPPTGARRSTIAFAAVRVGGQAIEYIGWIILARRLAPDAFGRLSIAFLLCRYAGVLADWGALIRGARDVAAEGRRGSVHALVRHRTILTIILTTAAAAILQLIGQTVLIPVVAVIPYLGLSRDWVSLGHGRGTRAAIPTLISGILVAVASLWATTAGGGAWVVCIGYGVPVVISIALNPIGPRTGGHESRPDPWTLLAFIATQLIGSFDTVLLGFMRNPAEAGIYAAVYRLPNAWLAIVSAVFSAWLPTATRALELGRESYRQVLRRALKISGLGALIPILAAIPLVWIITVLLGSDYADGRTPAVILMLSMSVFTFVMPLMATVLAGGRDRTYAAAMGTCLAVNIVVNLALIPAFGMIGAATATLMAQLALLPLLLRATSSVLSATPDIVEA